MFNQFFYDLMIMPKNIDFYQCLHGDAENDFIKIVTFFKNYLLVIFHSACEQISMMK